MKFAVVADCSAYEEEDIKLGVVEFDAKSEKDAHQKAEQVFLKTYAYCWHPRIYKRVKFSLKKK